MTFYVILKPNSSFCYIHVLLQLIIVIFSGVKKVLHANKPVFEHPVAELIASLVVHIQKKHSFTHLLAPASSFGKNVMPRIAAEFDVAPISDITAIESEDTFVRPIYAGNAIATVKSTDPLKV